MARYTRKRKEEIGLSPNALVFRGTKRVDKPDMRLIDYNRDVVVERDIRTETDLQAVKDSSNFSWLNVNGLHDARLMASIGRVFGVPDNILSDIMNPELRAKAEDFGEGVFVTLKAFRYHKDSELLSVDNFSLILFNNTLISFQEEPGKMFDPVRERLRKSSKKIRTEGSDYLAFALLDVIIDNYIYILSIIGDKIEQLEDQLYDTAGNAGKELLLRINRYKRELSFFRKHARPTREMVANLIKLDADCLHRENYFHFRELSDNAKEANDVSDTYREMLYDLMSMYHTDISTKLNDIMRVLTIISVIFIPITFIAGVYGTNFDHIPELHWQYGYIAMWGLMLAVAGLMLWYFKRKKWW